MGGQGGLRTAQREWSMDGNTWHSESEEATHGAGRVVVTHGAGRVVLRHVALGERGGGPTQGTGRVVVGHMTLGERSGGPTHGTGKVGARFVALGGWWCDTWHWVSGEVGE